MAIQLEPKWDEVTTKENPNDRNSSARLRFIAFGTPGIDNEFTARQATFLLAPATYGTLVIDDVAILGRLSDTADQVSWDVEVSYAHPNEKEQPKPNDETTTVLEIRSSGSETNQRTFSIALLQEKANLDAFKFTGTDAERALGLKAADADNGTSLNTQGIPAKSGKTQIIIHIWRSLQTVSDGFLLNLSDACDRQVVNSLDFFRFPPVSLQFSGYSATQKVGTDAGWDISLTLDYSRSVAVDIPGLPDMPITKKGFEYLDVLYMPKLVPVKGVVLSTPVRAAIHKLYDAENFYTLFKITP